MHKKAVRRARHERHRLKQRHRFAKHANASSRFVARHAPTAPQRRAHLPVPVLPLELRRRFARESERSSFWPWLLMFALAAPTALNHYSLTRSRTSMIGDAAHSLLPFNDLHQPVPASLDYALTENGLISRDFAMELAPRTISRETTLPAQLEPLRTDSLPLFLFDEELKAPRRLHWDRLIAVHAVTLGVGIYGLNYMNGIFGGVAQPFEVGNDWNKDHYLHFDELLHLQGAYRVTQAVSGVYQWAGVERKHADWIGAGTAAAFMTTMEYIDGRRKNDEASYSDFAANFLGAGLALAKPRWRALQDFDLRLSYRTLSDPFDRKRMKRYDRMTHWLTYDLQRKWKLPLHLGLGYSVQRPGTSRAKAEYFFGVGVSPQALVKNVLPSAAQPLRWLELYHFGNQVPINEAGTTTRRGKHK